MGIFCRKEIGMYYLKIKNGTKYRKISLSTKNRYLAEQMYHAYLLDEVKEKIRKYSNFKSSERSLHCKHTSISLKSNKRTKNPDIGLYQKYEEYLQSCKSQDLSIFTIQRKKKLWELLLELKIKNIRDINQVMINKFL